MNGMFSERFSAKFTVLQEQKSAEGITWASCPEPPDWRAPLSLWCLQFSLQFGLTVLDTPCFFWLAVLVCPHLLHPSLI